MATAGAALRLRLLYRTLRAGEVLALVAFLSWTSSRVPSAAAAALRLAGSLLLNARFVFVLGNAIVLLLLALSRRERDVSAASSSSLQTSAASSPQADAPAAADASCSSASFPSFATPALLTALPETAASFSAASPPPAAAVGVAREVAALAPPRAAAALAFVDKEPAAAARVGRLARAPRRSRSEKMGPRLDLDAARRAASPPPELRVRMRRSESENGRRRRSSVTARDAQACWGADDADEFRRTVEAFIAKQTRFHREESMAVVAGGAAGARCEPAPAFTGALAVVE